MHASAGHLARSILAKSILAVPVLAALLLQAGASPTTASTCGGGAVPNCGGAATFTDMVAEYPAVALVKVETEPDHGFILTVQAVFKGHFPAKLTFVGPVSDSSIDRSWRLTIVAFQDDPTSVAEGSLDLGGGTVAWHVTPDGRVDPERNWQVDGTPATLAGWFRYFHLPPSTSTAVPAQAPPAGSPLGVELAALAGIVAAALTLRRRRVLAAG